MSGLSGGGANEPAGGTVSAAEAARRLAEGNARFVAGRPQHPRQDAAHRRDQRTGQRPFAAIVGCADSRVPPEIVFDQGLGDIFVLRVAGAVVDAAMLGSLEYAVAHLGTPLIVVLAHARCGAVGATLAGGTTAGRLAAITDAIRPAVEATRGAPGDWQTNATIAHARATVERMRRAEPVLAPAVAAGAVEVVAMYYEIETGEVRRLA
jgi:carbonic anhydrase